MDKKYKIELIKKFLQGLTSQEEDVILKDWIKDPASRAACYTYYQQQWDTVPDDMDRELQAKILTKLLTQIECDEQSLENAQPVHRPRKTFYAIRKYIAAACLILAVSLGSYYWGTHSEKQIATDELITTIVDNGQKAEIAFPDGTLVHINSGSKLEYSTTYNEKDRTIILDGEAFFDVAKVKDKPFIVKANGLNIEALGTSFNIKAYNSDKSVAVTLIEGKVKVENGEQEEIIMKANDRLKYNLDNKRFEQATIHPNSDNILWRSKELAFYGETLEEICQQLSRMYGTQFIFKNEADKKYSFTGIIKNNSLENVLDFITLSAPVIYNIKSNNIIEITPKLK